jgi:EAL and modified HD-GYP domain-containing signal transduction protein
MDDVYIGRQPIYDRDLKVAAYELLFRHDPDVNRVSQHVDGDLATSQVLVHTFMEIGLDRVVGDYPAFINMTRTLLLAADALPFPRERVVLEVLEDIEIDPPLVAAARALAKDGFVLALDDFIYRAAARPLLRLARYIKLDILAMDRRTVQRHVTELRRWPVQLIAEKVENADALEFCRGLGFDLFQGFFFCRPHIVRGRRIPANRLAILRLLARLSDPAVETKELETLIGQDVSLSYRLLRLINSAYFGFPRTVDSVRQAVVYLGLRRIKSWVGLIVMSGIDDKPQELLISALIRARMSELLTSHLGLSNPDSAFTVGLFSLLDAMLDMTMGEILEQLPLTDELRKALDGHEGAYGRLLTYVLAYERGEWDRVKCSQLPTRVASEAYLDAIAWAHEASRRLR